MNRAAYIVDRFAAGSLACGRRFTAWATAWCRKGYRQDLTGWRAALGPIVRAVLLVAAAALVWLNVRARPALMWVLATGWLIGAWRASRPAPGEDAEEASWDACEQPPVGVDAEAVRALLLDLIGDARGVHLSTVLAHLQQHGQVPGWRVGDLRVRLEALGIPVERKLKLSGVPTRGVRRVDLLAPSPAPAAPPSPEASTAA